MIALPNILNFTCAANEANTFPRFVQKYISLNCLYRELAFFGLAEEIEMNLGAAAAKRIGARSMSA